MRSPRFLFEHKYTGATKSLSVKVEWLRDVAVHAIQEGLMPVLAFHIAGGNYVILLEDDFEELVERAYPEGA